MSWPIRRFSGSKKRGTELDLTVTIINTGNFQMGSQLLQLKRPSDQIRSGNVRNLPKAPETDRNYAVQIYLPQYANFPVLVIAGYAFMEEFDGWIIAANIKKSVRIELRFLERERTGTPYQTKRLPTNWYMSLKFVGIMRQWEVLKGIEDVGFSYRNSI